MATKAQINSFIDKLSALAIAECVKRDKKICPSVCIAQAALETGWGTSSLMTRANAYFGIKAGGSWRGKVYNSKTKECYDGKTLVDTSAYFRAYDSLADSVKDYYDLLTCSSRYSNAVNEGDATKCIKAIKAGGYATDPLYVSKITNIIKSYNLTKYDACMLSTSEVAETYMWNIARKVGFDDIPAAVAAMKTIKHGYPDAFFRKIYEKLK